MKLTSSPSSLGEGYRFISCLEEDVTIRFEEAMVVGARKQWWWCVDSNSEKRYILGLLGLIWELVEYLLIVDFMESIKNN